MKHLSILVIVVAVILGLGYFFADSAVLSNNAMKTLQEQHGHDDPASLNTPNTQTQSTTGANPSQSNAIIPAGKTGNPHFDQLSPEMQQALKEQLLLENPTETTIEGKNGTIILPAKGRFTQMPVAVQMPDGTIKIQEYSNIPTTPPQHTIKKQP